MRGLKATSTSIVTPNRYVKQGENKGRLCEHVGNPPEILTMGFHGSRLPRVSAWHIDLLVD